jgi:hypothetical protein
VVHASCFQEDKQVTLLGTATVSMHDDMFAQARLLVTYYNGQFG